MQQLRYYEIRYSFESIRVAKEEECMHYFPVTLRYHLIY